MNRLIYISQGVVRNVSKHIITEVLRNNKTKTSMNQKLHHDNDNVLFFVVAVSNLYKYFIRVLSQ